MGSDSGEFVAEGPARSVIANDLSIDKAEVTNLD